MFTQPFVLVHGEYKCVLAQFYSSFLKLPYVSSSKVCEKLLELKHSQTKRMFENTACDRSDIDSFLQSSEWMKISYNCTFAQNCRIWFSSDKIIINTFTNLIRRIHRLYSFFSFTSLGNEKNLQVWLSDEWLHDGAKQ